MLLILLLLVVVVHLILLLMLLLVVLLFCCIYSFCWPTCFAVFWLVWFGGRLLVGVLQAAPPNWRGQRSHPAAMGKVAIKTKMSPQAEWGQEGNRKAGAECCP